MTKKRRMEKRMDSLIDVIKETEIMCLSPQQKALIIWNEIVEKTLEDEREEYVKLAYANKNNIQ